MGTRGDFASPVLHPRRSRRQARPARTHQGAALPARRVPGSLEGPSRSRADEGPAGGPRRPWARSSPGPCASQPAPESTWLCVMSVSQAVSRCVLCRQAGWSRPGPAEGGRRGRGQGSACCRAPGSEPLPVSSLLDSHDTVPGCPNCVLLLFFFKIPAGGVEREFRGGAGGDGSCAN